MSALDIGARIAAVVLFVLVATGVAATGAYLGAEATACAQAGDHLGVRTVYRPWTGCQYVVFGYKVSAE